MSLQEPHEEGVLGDVRIGNHPQLSYSSPSRSRHTKSTMRFNDEDEGERGLATKAGWIYGIKQEVNVERVSGQA